MRAGLGIRGRGRAGVVREAPNVELVSVADPEAAAGTPGYGTVEGVLVERAATPRASRAAVETGEAPETAAGDNVRSPAVVLGCLRSIESGETGDVQALVSTATHEGSPAGR